MNTFQALNVIDVSKFVEQKGKFSYLSWSDAVNELLRVCPTATWTISKSPDGWPYTETPAGCFVEVSLTIEGVTRTQVHPVLDHKNQTVTKPNAFQINTSIQRCLAKAISLHGLGLYIYRGEDLPDETHRFKPGEKEKIYQCVKDALNNGDETALKEVLDEYDSPEEKQKIWGIFTSQERSSIKELLSDDK